MCNVLLNQVFLCAGLICSTDKIKGKKASRILECSNQAAT